MSLGIDLFLCGTGIFLAGFMPRSSSQIACVLIFLLIFLRQKKYRTSLVFLLITLAFFAERILWIPEFPAHMRGRVDSVKDTYFVLKMQDQSITVYGNYGVNFDDQAEISCSLEEIVSPHNRAGFQFDTYALSQRIRYSCSNAEVSVIKKGNTFRNRVYLKVLQESPETQAVLKRFLFHDYDENDGGTGLLMSTGMHIRFFLHFLSSVLGLFMTKRRKKPVMTSVTLFLFIFVRVRMYMVRILIAELLSYTKFDSKEKTGVLLVIMSFLYPYSTNQIGFYLPLLIRICGCFSSSSKYTAAAISVLCAMYANGYAKLSDTVSFFLLRPFFAAGYILCVLWIWLPVSPVLTLYSRTLTKISSLIPEGHLTLTGKPHIAVFLVMILLVIEWNSYRKKKSLVFAIGLLLCTMFQNYIRIFPSVTFIDVGQGDSALIQLPFHRGNIMIDTGGLYGKDISKEILYPVLSSYGITSLDAVLLSHEDFDHSGGFATLTYYAEVKTLITDKAPFYQAGDLVMKDYLYKKTYDDPNSSSLTQYFDLEGTAFFFSGDLTAAAEYDLVNETGRLDVDILKLAHHGSSTSTSKEILEAFRPKLAIISSGKHNRYHHPSASVIERLKNYRVSYMNTAYSGAITFTLFPGGYVMMSENGDCKIRFSIEDFLEYLSSIRPEIKNSVTSSNETDKIMVGQI